MSQTLMVYISIRRIGPKKNPGATRFYWYSVFFYLT
jgi:hypothetical protein